MFNVSTNININFKKKTQYFNSLFDLFICLQFFSLDCKLSFFEQTCPKCWKPRCFHAKLTLDESLERSLVYQYCFINNSKQLVVAPKVVPFKIQPCYQAREAFKFHFDSLPSLHKCRNVPKLHTISCKLINDASFERNNHILTTGHIDKLSINCCFPCYASILQNHATVL